MTVAAGIAARAPDARTHGSLWAARAEHVAVCSCAASWATVCWVSWMQGHWVQMQSRRLCLAKPRTGACCACWSVCLWCMTLPRTGVRMVRPLIRPFTSKNHHMGFRERKKTMICKRHCLVTSMLSCCTTCFVSVILGEVAVMCYFCQHLPTQGACLKSIEDPAWPALRRAGNG